MFASPRSRKAPHARRVESRDAKGAARRGSLRWLTELLRRAWRARLKAAAPTSDARIDPGCEPAADQPLSLLVQQRNELSARLLVHDPATHIVRNLFVIHDELRANGWPGVEALPLKIIDRALTEAEILATDDPSPMLDAIIDELRKVKLAADGRAELEARDREWATMQVPEVSDSDFGEFELAERSWAGTVPTGLEIPSRRG